MSSVTVPMTPSAVGESRIRRWLAPSVPEMLFLAIVLWLLAYTATGDLTGMGLLRDSQTGYHIRIGEYVMEHRAVPVTDFLSFTRPDEPFFAWEWLAGLGAALLYRWGGLDIVVVAAALIVGFSLLVMMRHMAARGANVIMCVVLIHFAIGASSIHYIARPHIFTLLFMAAALFVLDRDREQPSAWLWTLAPLTVLWANLHGGFFGIVASAGILGAGSLAEWLLWREADALRRGIRWSLLSALCLASSLLNPYGIEEHIHVIRFLRETWYLKLTEEFYPPNFFTASGAYCAVLLAAGIVVALRLSWKRQIAFGLLILAWACAASRSVRHVPIYSIVVLPWIAAECAELWRRWTPVTLDKIARDYQPSLARTSLFVPLVVAAMLACSGWIGVNGFPDALYPEALVDRHAGAIRQARVFATDAWGDYLSYRFSEPFRIYIDGRTDFFGEQFSREYIDTMNGAAGWADTLRRYHVDMVLIPPEVALAGHLARDSAWRLVERTDSAVLFEAARRAY